MIASVTAYVIRREFATLGFGRRELGAQFGELRLIDGMANAVFGLAKRPAASSACTHWAASGVSSTFTWPPFNHNRAQ